MKAKHWIATLIFWSAGLFAWIGISVIAGIGEGVAGKTALGPLVYLFGAITFFTLPLAFVVYVVKKIKNRKKNLQTVK